jgi:hypothetical protein
MKPEALAALVAKFPAPSPLDAKLAEPDKAAMDAALAELLAAGPEAAVGLVNLAKGGDNRVRHALHALATRICGLKDEAKRAAFAEALAGTLDGRAPADVRAFVVRTLQLVGGPEVAPALGRLLTDPALGDDAAQALVAIRGGAAEQFRAALDKATGRQRVGAIQALGVLRDADAAPALRPLVADKDGDVRLAAGWALANIGDAAAVDDLLRAADGTGPERAKLTGACLLLAERLVATGKKSEATAIYTRLVNTRTDPGEKHIRDAATRGLTAAGGP